MGLLAAGIGLLLAGASGTGAMQVHYPTADGFTVTADYLAPAEPSSRAVLILPGSQEGRVVWGAVADSLRGAGLHVLVPDLRGTGESAVQRGIRRERARFTNGELRAVELDAEAGLRYLGQLPATTIRAAVLLSSGDADLSALRARRGSLDRLARVLVSPASIGEVDVGAGDSAPLLVVVGNGDVVGIEASAALAAQDAHREVWLVDGSGGGAELLWARPDLVGRLAGWIDGALGDR